MIMPPLAEALEKPMKIEAHELIVLQAKYDGCQAIFVPQASGYQAFTRKGLVITRLAAQCQRLDAQGLTKVYFNEYMPFPWSEDGKHKLAGNLYTTDPLSFATQLKTFDCMDATEFSLGQMKGQSCKPRLNALDQEKEKLAAAGLEVAPWAEMTYADAKALCKSARIETPEGTRCLILGEMAEGGIIRAGNRLEKDKAKMDMDISVLQAVMSPKGQRGWIAVDTKRPTADGLMIVYGGITPQNHTKLEGKVVEVELLTVSGVSGGGNPTFRRDRSNEKEFDHQGFMRQFAREVADFTKGYGVQSFATVEL